MFYQLPILSRFFLVLFASAFVSSAAHASGDCEAIAAEKVEGGAKALGLSGERPLEAGGFLAKGEAVETGAGAWVDLRLCDGTGLRVGESSRMSFDEALSQNEAGFVGWAFELLRGSMLGVVTGGSKGSEVKLRVRTPTASVGVRGTEFLLEAGDGEETSLHTMEGEVLLGARDDFEKFRNPQGAGFSERFQKVGKEFSSRIRKGEGRPAGVKRFQLQEIRQKRPGLFKQQIQKMKREEVTQRWRQARQKFQEGRAKRGSPSPGGNKRQGDKKMGRQGMQGGRMQPREGQQGRMRPRNQQQNQMPHQRQQQRQDQRMNRQEKRQERRQPPARQGGGGPQRRR